MVSSKLLVSDFLSIKVLAVADPNDVDPNPTIVV